MPLRPMMGARAFAKWGIDYVGPISPPTYKTHAQYIVVATDYLTKWVEAKATQKTNARTTAQFLYEYVFVRYGLPIEIVSDRGTHFINEVIEILLDEFMVIHRKSAPYHPQANGQAEATNKTICTVLTKIVSESRTDWDQKLHSTLWAYRVAYKTSIGTTPYNMVFGLNAILPIEFLISTLRVAKDLEWTGHELSDRIDDLEKLDELRLKAVASIYAQKRRQKEFFDKHVRTKEFKVGDYVLVYTLKHHAKKLKKRGMGPLVIKDLSPSGAVKLATLDGEEMPNWISGCRVKKYLLPLTQDMLLKIHQEKLRVQKKKMIVEEAQAEAKERMEKRRLLRQKQRNEGAIRINAVSITEMDNDKEEPIIECKVGTNQIKARALLDSGAQANLLSLSLYRQLTNDTKLQSAKQELKSYSENSIKTVGCTVLHIQINQYVYPHMFYMVEDQATQHPLLLGQPWQKQYNAMIDWSSKSVLIKYEGESQSVKFTKGAEP
ncbi:DDE-type integrase/transposase/recombinase, partial [Enterobacter cloacae complex sp. GF14B]|uniref:DDE-type integrase/transposase/recombinase n=1 Tax=Enterobacter cloacae complex sp. GF14B TaxID=2511982 RepID=UPI00159EC2C3